MRSSPGAAEVSPKSGSRGGATRPVTEFVRVLQRLQRFVFKPWSEKVSSLGYRWVRTHRTARFPLRLPHGIWWIARNDAMGQMVLSGTFEPAEQAFVGRFLRPGMTVLDVGAHHGFYTMLASRRVGPSGRVIAFEPSPRERERLVSHLRLNRCRNVSVESVALADLKQRAPLFIVEGTQTGCNSLRPPAVGEPTRTEWVWTERLDDYLRKSGVSQIDLFKLDVEGGELVVLQGAAELLGREPRPVLLYEAEDVRTHPWGYRASDISAFLRKLRYRLFVPQADGSLTPLDSNCSRSHLNVVGIPFERLEELSLHLGIGFRVSPTPEHSVPMSY